MKTERFSKYFDNKISYNHLSYINPDWEEIIPQIHDAFEIIFVVKGNLIYTTGKKTYAVSDNSLILTRPGDYHMMNLNNCSAYERYDIIFDEKIVMDSCLKRLPEELDIIVPKNPDYFLSLFKKFDFYCEVFSSEELSRIISNLVEEVFFNIVHIAENPRDILRTEAFPSNPIVGKVMEYIEKHISEGFTVESLCSELYISKSYLLKLFNTHMQMSPKKYILSRQMIRAQNLIRSGIRPTEAFGACGFSDYSSFYRSYKSFFGYCPSEEVHTEKIRKIEH